MFVIKNLKLFVKFTPVVFKSENMAQVDLCTINSDDVPPIIQLYSYSVITSVYLFLCIGTWEFVTLVG